MNLVLVGKKRILYEKNKHASDMVIMFVPTEENVQIFHDLQGNKTDYEVASRAGMPDKKPIWREVNGKIVLYGWVPDDLTGRTASARVWLAPDFAPTDCTIFYFAISGQHLVHGRKEIDDENKVSWRVTTLQTATNEEMIELIKSSLVDQMMTGDNQVPCVAVYQNTAYQTQIDDALKHLQVTSQPLEKLSPAYRQVKPLYSQRNHTLVLLIMVMFFIIIMLASGVYWVLGMVESTQQTAKINQTQLAIQGIQINERIGYIREPEQIQTKIKSPFNQLPSAALDAPARTAALFGDIRRITFAVEEGRENTFMRTAGLPAGVHRINVSVDNIKQPMLVDQESLAKQVVASTPWLREISNMTFSGSQGLDLVMDVQVEETPEMAARREQEEKANQGGQQ